jgi:hypothetical protein
MANKNKNKNKNKKKNGVGYGSSIAKKPQYIRFQPDCFGFPDRLLTKLRYSDFSSVTSTSGGLGTDTYRWNSTFDPDETGTGHQPLYRDTYAAIYDHYAVVSARAIIRFTNTDVDSPIFITVNTDDDGTTSTTPQTVAEQSHGISTLLTPLSGSHSFHEFVVKWDCMEMLGIDPFTSETYKTAVGSNPTEASNLAISAATTDGSTASINYQIVLEQTVLWTELSTPTQS